MLRLSRELLVPYGWQLIGLYPLLFPRRDEDALPILVSCLLFDSRQSCSKSYSAHSHWQRWSDSSVAECSDRLDESWIQRQPYLLMYLLFTTDHLMWDGFGFLEYQQYHSGFDYGHLRQIYYFTITHATSATIERPKHMIDSSTIVAVIRLLRGSIKSSFY